MPSTLYHDCFKYHLMAVFVQYCGARPIMKVIFVLRRRVCNLCMKTQ